MNDWRLMRVKFLGKNSKKIMRKFDFMANQDQRLPKKNVGLIKGDNEIELEFMCLISRNNIDLIEYVVEEPNIDTLITLADYYKVSFEIYHTAVNGYEVGCSQYDFETEKFEILELDELDFYGCVFKDSMYHFEGEIYPNKYSLRKYVWYRKYRNKRIDAILEDID